MPETAACYDVEVVDKAASFEKSSFIDREGEGLQGHGKSTVQYKTVNQWIGLWSEQNAFFKTHGSVLLLATTVNTIPCYLHSHTSIIKSIQNKRKKRQTFNKVIQ